jgi:hypothetical protein
VGAVNPEEAHRRALADVNGDPLPGDGWRQLVALGLFVLGMIALVALASGHVTVSIH